MKQRYKLLIVDDEVSFSRLLQHELEQSDTYSLDLAFDGSEAINKIQNTLYDLVLLDIRLPRVDGTEVLKFLKEYTPTTPVIIITGNTDINIAIQSMKLGAYDYISKPYDIDELQSTIERALERKKLFIDNALMRTELSRKLGTSDIIGKSKAIRDTVERALKVGQSDSIALIQGASGTGKELIAHLIHNNSTRHDRPFVIVNCASIQDTLLESELFGHEKGAFTSAYTTKQGLVEVANGGTLFLDEVGDISPAIQPKLLRFLETGNFRRVGGVNELRVDVRIISATNKDLEQEARAGRFREDLLYRLNVVTLRVPLLRERKDDIPMLVEHFLQRKAKSKTAKKISPEAMEMFLQHDWPGNIRELEHVIEGAIIISPGDEIAAQDLLVPTQIHSPLSHFKGGSALEPTNDRGTNTIMPIDELEKLHIEAALKHFKGNRRKTALSLRISQKTLYLKIKRYGITVE